MSSRTSHRFGIVAFAAALTVLGSLPFGRGAASEETTPQAIITRLVERNPELSTFQAHVDVRLHTGLPFLNPALEGTTYFKRPDRYEVVFTKVPPYAKGIDKLYGDIGDPANWEKRFILSFAGHREYQGHDDVVVRLVQRVRGMIDHEDVLVDPRGWVVDEMSYYYYNGGVISLEQQYRNEGGFTVLSDQRATIALPHVPRANGNAHYSDYRLNVAIDDTVFTERQTKDLGTK